MFLGRGVGCVFLSGGELDRSLVVGLWFPFLLEGLKIRRKVTGSQLEACWDDGLLCRCSFRCTCCFLFHSCSYVCAPEGAPTERRLF